MLPEGHPHAWEVDHAHEHLDPEFRRRDMPPGARLVITPELRRLINGAYHALNRGTAIVVSGPWGCGKTTMLHALEAVADVNTVIVTIPKSANSPRAQWKHITTALTGTGTGTADDLQAAALDYVTQVPTLLIVDEAQHLRSSALEQLRWLWTSRIPRFAIVLSGSNLNERIAKEPALATRINQRILLNRSSSELMLQRVRASHPDLASTDDDLLQLIEAAYGDGTWRNWSDLMLKAINEFGHAGPLDRQTTEDVIHDRNGVPVSLAPVAPVAPTRVRQRARTAR